MKRDPPYEAGDSQRSPTAIVALANSSTKTEARSDQSSNVQAITSASSRPSADG